MPPRRLKLICPHKRYSIFGAETPSDSDKGEETPALLPKEQLSLIRGAHSTPPFAKPYNNATRISILASLRQEVYTRLPFLEPLKAKFFPPVRLVHFENNHSALSEDPETRNCRSSTRLRSGVSNVFRSVVPTVAAITRSEKCHFEPAVMPPSCREGSRPFSAARALPRSNRGSLPTPRR